MRQLHPYPCLCRTCCPPIPVDADVARHYVLGAAVLAALSVVEEQARRVTVRYGEPLMEWQDERMTG